MMNSGKVHSDPRKVSEQFEARLDRLNASEKVRAIVMLQVPIPARRRQMAKRDERRRAQVKSIRLSAGKALAELDDILARYDGKRLAVSIDALGCVPIETTVEGVKAIASSEGVKAVLEDQPIALVGVRTQ